MIVAALVVSVSVYSVSERPCNLISKKTSKRARKVVIALADKHGNGRQVRILPKNEVRPNLMPTAGDIDKVLYKYPEDQFGMPFDRKEYDRLRRIELGQNPSGQTW